MLGSYWYSCDLLRNLYLCNVNSTYFKSVKDNVCVVICLEICTFAR